MTFSLAQTFFKFILNGMTLGCITITKDFFRTAWHRNLWKRRNPTPHIEYFLTIVWFTLAHIPHKFWYKLGGIGKNLLCCYFQSGGPLYSKWEKVQLQLAIKPITDWFKILGEELKNRLSKKWIDRLKSSVTQSFIVLTFKFLHLTKTWRILWILSMGHLLAYCVQ